MKKILMLFVSLWSIAVYGQSTIGLVAHWDMNGSANDVTGHGHNGTAVNVTPAAGRDGIPNTAYNFNGINSLITAPYLSDLNVSNYSICAVLNVLGYNTTHCQTNTVFARGPFNHTGSYYLSFYDNPYDGDNCGTYDTGRNVFISGADNFAVIPITLWQYTPNIVSNTWYTVIATWNGSQYKIYVNGVLKTSNTAMASIHGTSTDSISIGRDIFESFSDVWPFKGVIDDIRFYNRALSDSEVLHYDDSTCGTITTHPVNAIVSPGHNIIFSVATSMPLANYQWQQDAGAGFTNLSNTGPYSGVTTPTLTITSVGSGLDNNYYRCIVFNENSCIDTSNSATLAIALSINTANQAEFEVYPIPFNESLKVSLGHSPAEPVTIELMDMMGRTVRQIKGGEEGEARIETSGLPGGFYIITVSNDLKLVRKKVFKN